MKAPQSDNSKFMVYQQDSFYIQKGGYETLKHLERFRSLLRLKKYTVSDSKMTSRVLSHWDDLKLLPQGINKDGWKKFTLVELVWMEALQRMRDFGLSLEKIREVKDDVLDWDESEKRYPVFEFYIANAWILEDDPYIVITQNGSDIGSSAEIENSKLMNDSIHMFLISLKSILRSLGMTIEKPMKLYSLSDAEVETLFLIRSGDVEGLNMRIKDQKITEIEFSEMIQGDESRSRDSLKNLVEDGAYGTVTEQYVKGVPSSIEIKRKKKF